MSWAPNYVTPEELAAYVRISDFDDDVQLGLAVAAASRAIDRTCKRQFGLADPAVARVYAAALDPAPARWVVDIDDLMTTDDLVIEVDTAGDGTYADELTAYTLKPGNAPADGVPWTRIVVSPGSAVLPSTAVDGVRVTARFGWTSVPDAVQQACLMQASRLLARRDAPFGVAGSPEAGSEVRLLAKVDPDVAVILGHYSRRWWAV